MNKLPWIISAVLLLGGVPFPTAAHGSCAHEDVHTYSNGPPGAGLRLEGGPGLGPVTVADSEMDDCDGDGVPGDFDGDLDVGVGGGAFGHGPWAEHCGFHQEAAGSVTVTDFLFGNNVAFAVGSGDTNSWVPDPTTGENTCLTDGIISPETDLEGDDCLSDVGTGTVTHNCPGGGDGLLWVMCCTVELVCDWNGCRWEVVCTFGSTSGHIGINLPTSGTLTSP